MESLFCPRLVAKYLGIDLSERKVIARVHGSHKSHKRDAGLCLTESAADEMGLPTRIHR